MKKNLWVTIEGVIDKLEEAETDATKMLNNSSFVAHEALANQYHEKLSNQMKDIEEDTV